MAMDVHHRRLAGHSCWVRWCFSLCRIGPATHIGWVPEHREWLLQMLERERQVEPAVPQSSFLVRSAQRRMWLLSIVYFGVSTTMYGVTLWLPSVIRSFSGLSYLY